MLFLALKVKEEEGLVHAQTISEAQGIPPHYLKQILIQLRASGMIRSTRGPNGGHTLAREPSEISIGDILRCLEGHLTGVEGILDMPCTIQIGPQHCVIKELLLEVKARVEDLVDRMSLDDLASRQNVILDAGFIVQPTTIMRRYGKPKA